MKHLYNGGIIVYINNLGHMTKVATMPIYGKNPSKIFFSETNRLISRKLGVKHRWLKYSNVYINHDPVMTLMDRILKILKKENGPRASSALALELNTIIFKHVYWYMQQISGERLQYHWSSGFYFSGCTITITLRLTPH